MLDSVLVRRERLVFVAADGGSDRRTAVALATLEADLAAHGYVLGQRLRAALLEAPGDRVAEVAGLVVPELARKRGAHVPHVPLFRRFPRTVPEDTVKLYVERVLTHWLATPEQPCLFCGRVDNVWVLDPCGHLVCGTCWDQTDYSACPICHRRIDPDSPFLRPSPPREPDPFARVLTRLDLGTDVEAAAERVTQRLLARAAVLSRADRDDLVALLEAGFPRRLPERIAVKETMAVVVGLGLRSGAVAFDDAREHLRTATDVLRALFVWMGAPEDLTAPPKPMPSVPRPLRRFILETLESFSAENLVQDLRRHAGLWKRVGEKLHPFEFMTRYPNTAAAFAVIRRTRVDEKLAMTAAGPVTVTWERVRARTWGTIIEEALVTGELEIALRLAAQRPGELARRFDHLLRRALAERPGAGRAARAAPSAPREPRRARRGVTPPRGDRGARAGRRRRHAQPASARTRRRRRLARRRAARPRADPAHAGRIRPDSHRSARAPRVLPARRRDACVRDPGRACSAPAARRRRGRRGHPRGAAGPCAAVARVRIGAPRRAAARSPRALPRAPRRPLAGCRPAREHASGPGRGPAAAVRPLDRAARRGASTSTSPSRSTTPTGGSRAGATTRSSRPPTARPSTPAT